MSDDEEDDYEYEYDDDMEEENLQYTDDEEEQDDTAVALENAYYNAKASRTIEAFEQVLHMEQSTPSLWSFKAMKQIVKLRLRQNHPAESILSSYQNLLKLVPSISQNAVEKGIGSMLDRISNDPIVAPSVYDATIPLFHPNTGDSPNERLWFKANLKYAQWLILENQIPKLAFLLKELSAYETTSTNQMEIFALQMQFYERTHETQKLRATFANALNVRGGIPHPRTIAMIQELGGKMHMQAQEYAAAEKTFFQAFKSYDEAGDIGRLRCLKYLVLASMLSTSTINPFDSQEARPYKEDPEIANMTKLVQAFHDNDITSFEKILKQGRIMEKDDFIRQFVSELLRTIRTQVILNYLVPYRRIRLESIAAALNHIPVGEVEGLLINLILDGQIQGSIDATEGILMLDGPKAASTEVELQCIAMNQLLDQVMDISRNVSKGSTSTNSTTGSSLSQLRSVIGL